ncbi:MAG: DUF465 domain-containing protein [Nitrospinota bacterium]|nr:DUF465 domain-containing protein [Nitrospinota bacterium]
MEIEKDLLEKVKSENQEFKKLFDEHTELKVRVEELNKLKFLTSEEEMEKKKIQVHKLHLKDKLEEMLSQYQANLH